MATTPQSHAWSPLSHQTSPYNDANLEGSLDLSPRDTGARQGMLTEPIFPDFHDGGGPDMASPEEMQRKDPLGTQMWKMYSRARMQLPNAERMENLTWRMCVESCTVNGNIWANGV